MLAQFLHTERQLTSFIWPHEPEIGKVTLLIAIISQRFALSLQVESPAVFYHGHHDCHLLTFNGEPHPIRYELQSYISKSMISLPTALKCLTRLSILFIGMRPPISQTLRRQMTRKDPSEQAQIVQTRWHTLSDLSILLPITFPIFTIHYCSRSYH